MKTLIVAAVALFASLLGGGPLCADPGKPVAVRWWGQGLVTIETYWSLSIAIDPYETRIGYADPKISADLVLITHEHSDHNNAKLIGGQPVVVHGLDAQGRVQTIHQVLDRLPNTDQPAWRPVAEAGKPVEGRSGHEIVVTSIPAWHDDAQGGQRGAVAMFLIEVDGVRILHCGDLGQTKLTDEQRSAIGRLDVLLLPVGGVFTIDGRQASQIVRQVSPRIVVPIHYKTPPLTIDLQPVDSFLEAMKDEGEAVRPVGNTVAVAAIGNAPSTDERTKVKIVVPKFEPWQPPAELAALFDKLQADSRAAQPVFAKLSVNQMNFKPSNGTHTPRWNSEHMMASELLFFTQIYSRFDPTVPAIRLSPAQMPADYKPAHADWTGAEEARQMERASALVRRFSYLLDGIGLDDQLPGRRGTLRNLFRTLDGHYNQHTANVKAKLELPDWPKE